MIAGLLQNHNSNSIKKAPFLGDLPILGALFRSTSYQRDETELVIIVTPYLVRPSSAPLALPTNGYRAPTDAAAATARSDLHRGQRQPRADSRSAPPLSPCTPATAGAVAAPGFRK